MYLSISKLLISSLLLLSWLSHDLSSSDVLYSDFDSLSNLLYSKLLSSFSVLLNISYLFGACSLYFSFIVCDLPFNLIYTPRFDVTLIHCVALLVFSFNVSVFNVSLPSLLILISFVSLEADFFWFFLFSWSGCVLYCFTYVGYHGIVFIFNLLRVS